MKTLNLKEGVLSQVPELSPNVVNNISNLVDYYQLAWFSDRDGQGVYFLLADVARVMEVHSRSIMRTWKNFQNSKEIKNAPIPPACYMLRGEEVKELRLREPKLDIPVKCNNLNICNWTMLYALRITPEFPLPNVVRSNNRISEKLVQSQLIGIASYTPNPLTREMTVKDCMPNPVNTRRFDLVRKFKNEIHIYELKSRVLENEDVASTIGTKGYLELATSHFNSKVKFNFVAEGITSEASRMLRAIGNVGFITIKDLAHKLKGEVLDQTPDTGKWFYEKEIFPAYSILR